MIFNQHLAQLTTAGMPVEQSLRLIAQDMKRGRLAHAIRSLAAELEQGKPLAQAFDSHRSQFPPLYGRLIDAGIAANNLPGMLLNLGRHYEMVHRLRSAMVLALTYPAILLMMVVATSLFLSLYIFPSFEKLYDDFGTPLPLATQGVLATGRLMGWVALAGFVLLMAMVIGWHVAKLLRLQLWLTENVLARIPLLGVVVRHSTYARWCNAMQMGIDAGLPLPESADLAGQAVGWKSLQTDGRQLAQAITLGQFDTLASRRWVLPASIRTAIAYAHDRQSLPQALASLTVLQQQLAASRLLKLQVMLLPILTIVMGGFVALAVMLLVLPMIKLLTNLT